MGQTYCSICSTIRSVPLKWLTYGGMAGLYIVSVMSRTSTTFLPFLAICRRPNGRPSTHMLVWTPTSMTFLMPKCSRMLQFSTPSSVMIVDVFDFERGDLPDPGRAGIATHGLQLVVPLLVLLHIVILTTVGMIDRVTGAFFGVVFPVAPGLDLCRQTSRLGNGLRTPAGRMILVESHARRRRMDDRRPTVAGRFQQLVHPRRHLFHSTYRVQAMMGVPHVADNHGCFPGIPALLSNNGSHPAFIVGDAAAKFHIEICRLAVGGIGKNRQQQNWQDSAQTRH